MKQHLSPKQLKELSFEDRITLLSIATGFNKPYLKEEYEKGMKNEDAMLLEYGYNVKMGDLIEIVTVYTGNFPTPTMANSYYSIALNWKTNNREDDKFSTSENSEYVDALFEIVKYLFHKEYIYIA